MGKSQNSELLYLGIFPKCPFYKSLQTILIILVLITIGTIGIKFFDSWIAVGYFVYSMLFYFLIMPFKVCKYCYFKVKQTTVDEETGKTVEKLLSVDEWSQKCLKKHVGQKNWAGLMIILWFAPIVFTVISLFLNFSIFAPITLIGFIAVLIGNYLYMIKVKCPKCAKFW